MGADVHKGLLFISSLSLFGKSAHHRINFKTVSTRNSPGQVGSGSNLPARVGNSIVGRARVVSFPMLHSGVPMATELYPSSSSTRSGALRYKTEVQVCLQCR